MTGMSRVTGSSLEERAHISQSIADILTTPLGSRVMRREYGSLLPDLIDQPTNSGLVVRLYAAVIAALMRWEPRINITRMQLTLGSTPGAAILDIYATLVSSGTALALQVPLKLGATA